MTDAFNYDCNFSSQSPYLRCAPKPDGPCEGCEHFTESPERVKEKIFVNWPIPGQYRPEQGMRLNSQRIAQRLAEIDRIKDREIEICFLRIHGTDAETLIASGRVFRSFEQSTLTETIVLDGIPVLHFRVIAPLESSLRFEIDRVYEHNMPRLPDRFFEEGGQALQQGVQMLAEMHEQKSQNQTQSLQAKIMDYAQQKLFRLRPVTQFLQARWPIFWRLWSASAAIALPLIAIGMPLSMAWNIGLICILFRRQILFARMIQAEEPYSSSVSREHRESLIVIALFFILSVALRFLGGFR
jgi:hypothetical protein